MKESSLKKYHFQRIICDEAQNIKNLNAKRTAKAVLIQANNRWLSTGNYIIQTKLTLKRNTNNTKYQESAK